MLNGIFTTKQFTRKFCITATICDILYVVSYSAENILLWYFGFHYYNCGKKMSYFIKQKPLPSNLNSHHQTLFWTGIVFACLLPLAYAVINTL